MHKHNVDVYVAGSHSKFLSSDTITEFRGRKDEVRVYPFSFSEYYEVNQGKTSFVRLYALWWSSFMCISS